MSDLISEFPEILPMEELLIEGEDHEYQVIEYDDGTAVEKTKYVPNKSPVLEVQTVGGQVNGEDFTFTEGVDYEVIDDDNDGRLDTIDFSIGGERPDDNTVFEITYVARSVMLRYIEAYQDELERFGDDIDGVIDSHYVDFAGEVGYVDTFEDEQMVEYETQAGDEAYYVVQSDLVRNGEFALEINSPAGVPTRVASKTGLDNYPRRGDTFVYYTYLSHGSDISRFDFLYSEADAGQQRFYRTELDADTDTFTIQKRDGVKSDSASVSLSNYTDSWLRVEVNITATGTIEAELRTENNVLLDTVSIVDTEYNDGGIRIEAENPSATSEVYFDTVDIIRRDSTDLDRVGAIFGELGRRRGRPDDDYATFIKSIVESFAGRGTVSGIKFAVASALDVDSDQITIVEDFQENEYIIDLTFPFPAHEIDTLVDLADLADPSGVRLATLDYEIDEDTVAINDTVDFTVGTVVDDQVGADDTITVTVNSVAWDDANWDDFSWAVENN